MQSRTSSSPALCRSYLAAMLLSALSLGACSDDEPDCPSLIRACDISQLSCQREVFAATACTRGQRGAKMPPIRAITRDEFAEELSAEAGEDDDFELRAWGKGLSLFGLLPAEQSFTEADIAQQVENVAAYYRRDVKDVTIIVDGDMDAREGTFVLSHEFMHALQDQREDLAKFYEEHARTSDAALALRCLTEGEATALSNLTMPGLAQGDPNDADWDAYFGEWRDETLTEVFASERPLLATRSLVYPIGGHGVIAAFLQSGLRGVERLYARPAITFRGWLWQPPQVMQPEPMDCAPPEPPDGYERRFFDRQGAAALISLHAALGFAATASYDVGHAWVSDWYAVYTALEEASEEVAVAWRIRFGSHAAAARFDDRLSSLELAFSAQRDGQEVLLIAASSEELLAAWDTSGGCATEKSRAPAPLDYRVPRFVGRWVGHGAHR